MKCKELTIHVLKRKNTCKKILKNRVNKRRLIINALTSRANSIYIILLLITKITNLLPSYFTELCYCMLLFNSIMHIVVYYEVSLCMLMWYFHHLEAILSCDIEIDKTKVPSLCIDRNMSDYIYLYTKDNTTYDTSDKDIDVLINSTEGKTEYITFNPLSVWFACKWKYPVIWDFCNEYIARSLSQIAILK